ncbi:MAG: hypothetical protein ACE5GH_07870, partial [Fidelibacterota bacterium]
FAPVLEIQTYFFNASVAGWPGIAVVCLTFGVTTVSGMIFLVDLARKGLEIPAFNLLERYEKQIMGLILLVIAFFTYFMFEQGLGAG